MTDFTLTLLVAVIAVIIGVVGNLMAAKINHQKFSWPFLIVIVVIGSIITWAIPHFSGESGSSQKPADSTTGTPTMTRPGSTGKSSEANPEFVTQGVIEIALATEVEVEDATGTSRFSKNNGGKLINGDRNNDCYRGIEIPDPGVSARGSYQGGVLDYEEIASSVSQYASAVAASQYIEGVTAAFSRCGGNIGSTSKVKRAEQTARLNRSGNYQAGIVVGTGEKPLDVIISRVGRCIATVSAWTAIDNQAQVGDTLNAKSVQRLTKVRGCSAE